MSEEKRTSPRELLKEFNHELLTAAGYGTAQMVGFGDLSQMSLESLEALVTRKAAEHQGELLRKKTPPFGLISKPRREKRK